MDGGRYGYHVGSFVTAAGIGAAYGGGAGAIVGVGAKAGEMTYDTFKEIIKTINGQFQNLINIH